MLLIRNLFLFSFIIGILLRYQCYDIHKLFTVASLITRCGCVTVHNYPKGSSVSSFSVVTHTYSASFSKTWKILWNKEKKGGRGGIRRQNFKRFNDTRNHQRVDIPEGVWSSHSFNMVVHRAAFKLWQYQFQPVGHCASSFQLRDIPVACTDTAVRCSISRLHILCYQHRLPQWGHRFNILEHTHFLICIDCCKAVWQPSVRQLSFAVSY